MSDGCSAAITADCCSAAITGRCSAATVGGSSTGATGGTTGAVSISTGGAFPDSSVLKPLCLPKKTSSPKFRYTHITTRVRIRINTRGSLPVHLRLYGSLPSISITSTPGLITPPPKYPGESTTLTSRAITTPFRDQTSCSQYSMKTAPAAFDSSYSSNRHCSDLIQRVSAAGGSDSGSSM